MLAVTIWMNMPSFYQSDLFRALVDLGDIDLEVIFAGSIPAARVELGWQNDLTGYPHRFLSSKFKIIHAMCLAWTRRKRVHVVGGLWGEKAFAAALVILAIVRSEFALYSEAPAPSLLRPAWKRALRSCLGAIFVRYASGVFAISHFGIDFFKQFGARNEILYPFGYFRTVSVRPSRAVPNAEIEAIFIGQLVHRKGVDILLRAIAPLFQRYPRLFLTCIGAGEEARSLQDTTVLLGIAERVRFEAPISASEIPARLQQASFLVLPSRWDGWGLVANEALSAGVPVVISDRCGAADLIQNGRNGYVFRSEDYVHLRSCLEDFLSRENDWPHFKHNATVIGNSLSAESAASYFVACIRHMAGELLQRPNPPWHVSAAQTDRIKRTRANIVG